MANITHLSDLVIDQIAAGEIIDRPSSVVKELLENSIDSGANMISLNINEGGIARIEVCDNGRGIDHKDLPLSVARHATSKIKDIADLNHCKTHGFRGEALSSISSVSELKVISKNGDNSGGYKLEKIDSKWTCSPSAAKKGTTVIVEDLFFKFPARRKFLKTKATEHAHCRNSFIKTSLVHNNINWYFYSNGKELIKMPEQLIHERFANLCGMEANRINHIKKTIGPVTFEACFPFSENERKIKNNQFIYVNNRAINNKTLMHAVNSAFDAITHGKNDFNIFLSLKMPNQLVDFNVHPSKTEVRFKDNSAIYEIVTNCLRESFKKCAGEMYTNEIFDINAPKKNPTDNHLINEVNLPKDKTSKQKKFNLQSLKNLTNESFSEQSASISPINKIPPLGYALAQLHGIYILAENSTGLIIVDTHAAHERILFENYKKNIGRGNLEIQKLVSPVLIQLSEDKIEVFIKNSSLILKMGFDVIKIGSDVLSLRGVPDLTKNLDGEKLFLEIIEDLSAYGHAQGFDSRLMELLGNLACRSAIKANRKMTIPEMNSLLRAMEKTDYGGKCNHGRPSWAELNLENIDKIFLRGR